MNKKIRMPHIGQRNALFTRVGTALCATALLATAACSTAPVNEGDFARVENSIEEAVEMDARDLAGKEIFSAEKKLAAAKTADSKGKREEAARLLAEARVHAELAQASSMAMSQQKALIEVNAGLSALERVLKKGDK